MDGPSKRISNPFLAPLIYVGLVNCTPSVPANEMQEPSQSEQPVHQAEQVQPDISPPILTPEEQAALNFDAGDQSGNISPPDNVLLYSNGRPTRCRARDLYKDGVVDPRFWQYPSTAGGVTNSPLCCGPNLFHASAPEPRLAHSTLAPMAPAFAGGQA